MVATEETAPARLRNTPSRLVTQTAVHAHRLVAQGLAAAGAHRYHYALLAALEEFGPASQAELGRRGGMDRSDVVAAINELVDRKLVRRTPDPSDRRRNTITITVTGRRQLRRLDGVLAGIQDDLLEPLSGAERTQLTRLLTRVLDHHAAKQG
jgi:DNA-binding MarR family transcriptional regulator